MSYIDGNKFHFTEDDFKVLAKECADLSDLQLPACEVKFTECIGEGLFIFSTNPYPCCKAKNIYVWNIHLMYMVLRKSPPSIAVILLYHKYSHRGGGWWVAVYNTRI